MLAAWTAYAAYLQGKFWEMHDVPYAKQKKWSETEDAYTSIETMADG